MKKIKKNIAVVAALLLMSSSYASTFSRTANLNYEYRSCTLYAHSAVYLEAEYYGGMSESDRYKAFLWYLGECQAAGGYDNIDEPVFL